jgi:catechol 2,3-dioxygenase-like lactoylglutathione lyase family enzyme
MNVQVILYVRDQATSSTFYRQLLDVRPSVDVPGMTEFVLGMEVTLGLMPEAGIRRLLGQRLPDPAAASGIPRAKLYLHVDDPAATHNRALELGATEVSPPAVRDWGDLTSYVLDPDGHVVAFARRAEVP